MTNTLKPTELVEVTQEELAQFQKDANLPYPPTPLTIRYRLAVEGEGADEFLSLGYQWRDKPHRLVWDLCGVIEEQAANTRTPKVRTFKAAPVTIEEDEDTRSPATPELIETLERLSSATYVPPKAREACAEAAQALRSSLPNIDTVANALSACDDGIEDDDYHLRSAYERRAEAVLALFPTPVPAVEVATWEERCETHPAHEGIVTEAMIQQRMQEEIDELRAVAAALRGSPR